MDFLSVKEFFTKVSNWIASVKAWMAKPDGPSMTETELNTFLDSLNRNFRGSVDWIVEEGTDGIWTYRKWDSGLCKVYGTYSDTSSTAYTSAGVGYYRTLNVNLPSVLTSIDNPQVSAKTGNVGGTTLLSVNATTISVLIFSTTSTGRPIDLYISIIGRWK